MYLTTLQDRKTNSFFPFLGEVLAWQFCFHIYRPLVRALNTGELRDYIVWLTWVFKFCFKLSISLEKQRLIDDSSEASPELFAIKEDELLSSSSGLVMPPLLVDEGSFLNDLKKAVVDEVGGDDEVGDVASSSPLPFPPPWLLLLLLCCCRRNNWWSSSHFFECGNDHFDIRKKLSHK